MYYLEIIGAISGLIGLYAFLRRAANKDLDKLQGQVKEGFQSIRTDIQKLDSRLCSIENTLISIDNRFSRLEGANEERRHSPTIYLIKGDKITEVERENE